MALGIESAKKRPPPILFSCAYQAVDTNMRMLLTIDERVHFVSHNPDLRKELRLKIAVTAWMSGTKGLASELAKQGKIAEQMGFHSFWLPENHFGDHRSLPAPLMLLSAVAATTSSIRLGSTSYLLPIRNPILAAEDVAVLDRLSGGRVILGVGRGVQPAMFDVFDIPVKEKRLRFKKNLDIMIDAWRGKPIIPAEGNQESICLAPLPVQTPHPPIWVAAFGPLALKQAGTLGLPYLASPVETLTTLTENYQTHREHAKNAGVTDISATPVMRTLFVSNNKTQVKEVKAALEGGMGHAMRPESATVDDWTIVGEPSYVREKILEYENKTGMTHLIVRGQIPGISNEAQLVNFEQLLALF